MSASTRFVLVCILLSIDAIKSQLTSVDSLNPAFTISNGSHPNIIFILTDDWGYNDVGWTNENTDTRTPYLDNLAKTESLILSNYYVERVCTASRAAFLTGRYPSNLGLQSGVIAANQPASLTRQVSMLSNEFQASGYSTHLIGKWHLGMMAYEYTPTYRGFDTFYGFWAGGEDYFNHQSWSFMRQVKSMDLFINEKPALFNYGFNYYQHPYDNVYGVWWQKAESLKLLQSKLLFPDKTAPFFFYLALQASHSPHQAPAEYTALYANGPNADNSARIMMQAQTTTADDAIRDIVEYLKQSHLWDNTLVIINSDNGAKRHFGDNAPFRGFKNTSWEGGVKVPCMVTGGYLPETQRGKTMTYPVHMVDWYPTLLSAAGLDINYERSTKLYESEENFNELTQTFKKDARWEETPDVELDGIDMWDFINGDDEDDEYFHEEREILLDLKDVWCPYSSCGALRIGRYKYIRGANIATLLPDYEDGDKWYRNYVKNDTKAELSCRESRTEFEQEHSINEFMITAVNCVDSQRGCLFDLQLDPCEYYDLSSKYPDLVSKFQKRLNEWQDRSEVALIGENNPDELFGKDVIQPERVCHNPQFWCPFMKYKDVEFEYKLYPKRAPITAGGPGGIVDGFGAAEWIMYVVIPVCVAVVMIGIVVYCCYAKKRKKEKLVMSDRHSELLIESDILDDIAEVQPLKADECEMDQTRLINLGQSKSDRSRKSMRGKKVRYGSTLSRE